MEKSNNEFHFLRKKPKKQVMNFIFQGKNGKSK